jgi:hypothetical protein
MRDWMADQEEQMDGQFEDDILQPGSPHVDCDCMDCRPWTY